jgi:hypothetical protein
VTGLRCRRTVVWLDVDVEARCVLPVHGDGVHCDGLRWFDNFGLQLPRDPDPEPEPAAPGVCVTAGCGKPSRARGRCVRHYQAFARAERVARGIPELQEA